ncbi:hypothetical protein [Streptomyces sp. NPDC057280]|uniref:hypothetical protein n=1 Tax=Streptomyces sp. NPDC057280 TaxID=3346081 RepID=UPI00363B352C
MMFETTEYNEWKADRHTPVILAMPRQAPPVDRTRSAPTHTDGTSGVEASTIFGTILRGLGGLL